MRRSLVLPLLVGLLLPANAQAATMTITGDDARLIAQVAQRVGDTDIEDDVLEMIKIVVHRDDGTEWFRGSFIGCNNGKACQALSLNADFGVLNLTSDQLNLFNREHFYVTAYTSFTNAVVLRQEVSLINGVNDQWLYQTMATFGQVVDRFNSWAATAAVEAMIQRLKMGGEKAN